MVKRLLALTVFLMSTPALAKIVCYSFDRDGTKHVEIDIEIGSDKNFKDQVMLDKGVTRISRFNLRFNDYSEVNGQVTMKNLLAMYDFSKNYVYTYSTDELVLKLSGRLKEDEKNSGMPKDFLIEVSTSKMDVQMSWVSLGYIEGLEKRIRNASANGNNDLLVNYDKRPIQCEPEIQDI